MRACKNNPNRFGTCLLKVRRKIFNYKLNHEEIVNLISCLFYDLMKDEENVDKIKDELRNIANNFVKLIRNE